MVSDPDENEDVLAFGDTKPRIPRRIKRLAAAGTVVAGAVVAVSLLAFHGTNHAPAPARSATQPSAETVYEFQGNNAQEQTATTITRRIYNHGNWVTVAIPASAAIPASRSRNVKLDPAAGHPSCP
jgi:hypothetical protein